MNATPRESTNWPLPKFSFYVTFGSQVAASFQDVSGLGTETQVIEHRHGNRPQHSTTKMPGDKKLGDKKLGHVTLKKGAFVTNNAFRTWYSSVSMNTIARSSVTIQLLDPSGAPTMTWTLTNARPTKINATTLKSDGDEVAVETIEVAYEVLTIAPA